MSEEENTTKANTKPSNEKTTRDKIIELLKNSTLTHEQIASYVGVKQPYVSKIAKEENIERPRIVPAEYEEPTSEKPAEYIPPQEPEPPIDETLFTKQEVELIHMMPKYGQQALANKFLQDRTRRIELEKRYETGDRATARVSKPTLPLSDEMSVKLADAATAVALAKQFGISEEEMWNLIKQQQSKRSGSSKSNGEEKDPLDYVMQVMAKATAIKIMEKLQKGESESSKPLTQENIAQMIKKTIEEIEPRKQPQSLTVEDVQKMLEAQAKEYELKTLRETVKELRERGKIPEELEATLKRLEEEKKSMEKQLDWFKQQLEDKKLVEVVQQQVSPIASSLNEMREELIRWKTIAEMVKGKPESTIESELTSSFKEAAIEKIKEWVQEGFVKKEEVVEPQTGKINWGKVINKGIDVFGKALEKAQLSTPPERRIIPIIPQTPYPQPQTEQPQTFYQQPPPETYKRPGFFDRLIIPKPEPIPQQLSSIPKEEIISGPKIEYSEENRATSPIETGRRPEESKPESREPTERTTQPSEKRPSRRKT